MTMTGQDNKPLLNAAARTFMFLSSCPEPWGGSEELWSNAARHLACAGNRVHVIKTLVDFEHKRIKELLDLGITVDDHWNIPVRKSARVARRMMPQRWSHRLPDPAYQNLVRAINRLRPALTVISQGENFDGIYFAEACHHLNVPYVLICQKASDQHWPSDHER